MSAFLEASGSGVVPEQNDLERRVLDLEQALACAMEVIEEQGRQIKYLGKRVRWHELPRGVKEAEGHACPTDCGCDKNPAFLRGLAVGSLVGLVRLEELGWKRLAEEVRA